jgi:hypothetical protein
MDPTTAASVLGGQGSDPLSGLMGSALMGVTPAQLQAMAAPERRAYDQFMRNQQMRQNPVPAFGSLPSLPGYQAPTNSLGTF